MPASMLNRSVTLSDWERGEAVLRPNPKASIGTASAYQEPGWTDCADESIERLRSTSDWRRPGNVFITSDVNRPAGLGADLISDPSGCGFVYVSSGFVRSALDLSHALVFEPVRLDRDVDYGLGVPALTSPFAGTEQDEPAMFWSMAYPCAFEGLEGPASLEGDHASVVRGLLTHQEHALREEIRSYADLPDDWDGDGAVAPCQQAVADALAFLESRPLGIPLPLPEVVPIGDVGVYWDRGGIFVEVQFGGDGAFSYYAERKEGRTIVEDYGSDGLPLEGGWPEDMVRLLRPRVRS